MANKNEIPMYYNKHYIRTNDQNHIIVGFSDAFREPTENDICINEQGGYQFRLVINGELTQENPPLFDSMGLPLYKYIEGEIIEVTAEEKAAIITARPKPGPTLQEQVELLSEALDTILMEM